MRRLLALVWVALLSIFLVVSTGSAERQDPNVERISNRRPM